MAMAHSYGADESVKGTERVRSPANGAARPPRTINDIGSWFSRRYDGTRIAGFCPVLLLSSFSRGFSFLLQRCGLTLRAFTSSFFSSSSSSLLLFFLRSERRQVGVRAAVNSPAPLSALMSLLLFALLNAIRAYSVSLPLLLGPDATTSFF